jgi:hypothetical protein
MYSSKYLKYKNKYLNLKQFGGTAPILISNKHSWMNSSNKEYCTTEEDSISYIIKKLVEYEKMNTAFFNEVKKNNIYDIGTNGINDDIAKNIVDANNWRSQVGRNQCKDETCKCLDVQPIKKTEINQLVETFVVNLASRDEYKDSPKIKHPT